MGLSLSPKSGSQKARNTAARLVAVQCVYDMILTGHAASDVLAGYKDHRHGQRLEEIDFVPADLELLGKIVRGVEERRADLLEMVQGALEGRKGQSQPEALLRALLLCGAYEILAHHEIHAPLIISEYLAVAEGFFSEGEVKLAHAVLDRLNKVLRG
jgi:N utilization substance protein B